MNVKRVSSLGFVFFKSVEFEVVIQLDVCVYIYIFRLGKLLKNV